MDACREILTAHPTIRVIFLTSYADNDSVLAAVLAGAHGYVLKEIGTALTLSDKTVKNYLGSVFQKLRITRRAQAAAFIVKRHS